MPCSERILKMVGGEEKDCEKGGGGGERERNHSTLTTLLNWTFQLLLFYSLEVGDHMSWLPVTQHI